MRPPPTSASMRPRSALLIASRKLEFEMCSRRAKRANHLVLIACMGLPDTMNYSTVAHIWRLSFRLPCSVARETNGCLRAQVGRCSFGAGPVVVASLVVVLDAGGLPLLGSACFHPVCRLCGYSAGGCDLK